MSGPAPATQRRRRNKPARGDWKPSPGSGWQHGPIPEPPEVGATARDVWNVWFTSWWAANWEPSDLPLIRVAIQLYHKVQVAFEDPFVEVEGKGGHMLYIPRPNPVNELQRHMDAIGATFKGRQDRRWTPPKAETVEPEQEAPQPGSRFAHLRAVG
jgi:hypothetical protein